MGTCSIIFCVIFEVFPAFFQEFSKNIMEIAVFKCVSGFFWRFSGFFGDLLRFLAIFEVFPLFAALCTIE
jgi:hypothetical protein